jgi:hypothetical protein
MAFVHGKNTYVSLNAVNLSAFCNNSEKEKTADEHDVTTYGKNSHVFAGGLKGGKCTISGIYDNTTAGPHDTIDPLVGSVVALVHRSEGTGSGLPQDTVNVLVKSYKESAPVADMVMWTTELTYSDDVTSTNQA